jgi:hypothetical protein
VSHCVAIDIEIKDLDALATACKELGLELRKNQKQYRWYGRSVGDYPLPAGFTADELGHCEHAIAVTGKPQAYEIGLVKRKDSKAGYTLLYDFWAGGNGLMEKVGEECKALRQRYAVCVAERHARKQGFRTVRKQAVGGKIQVIARR